MMSIYATLWEIKIPKNHRFDSEWVSVYAQAVPAHIGHPSHYPEGDIYSDFLPPVVECDPKTGHGPFHRAVVIVAEGREEKIVQRYSDPLMTLTGREYAVMPFEDLLEAIKQALQWDRDVVALAYGTDGQQQVIRVPGWQELEKSKGSSTPTVE